MRCALVVGTLLGLAASAASAPALAQGQIGRAAAVVPQAQGTPPQGAARVLQIGLDMFQNERVQTGPEGRTQLLFVDGTALTVGPNSDLLLDEYVYDPNAGSGKIALSATRGVFRIVGGKISKGEPITLRTPTVTIGVRGGVAFASVGETVSAGFVFGDEMTATGGGRTERTTRPGTEIITPPNGVPNPPQPLSDTTISSSLNATEGTAGGTSDGPSVSDEDVAQSQVAELSSSAAPDVAIRGLPLGAPTNAAAIEKAAGTTEASQIVMTEEASGGDSALTGPLVGRYKTSAVPGVEDGTGDDSPSFNIAFTGGSISGGQFRATAGSSLLTFPVSPNSGGMFSFGSSDMTDSPFGPITGSGWITAAGDYGFIEYLEDDFPGFRGIAFFGTPTPAAAIPTGLAAYDLRNDFVLGGSHVPFIPNSLNGDIGPGGAAYINWAPTVAQRSAFLGGAVVISGQGSGQRWAASVLVGEVADEASQPFIRGEMRGSARRAAGDALSVFLDGALASSDAGDGSDFLGAQADFVLEALEVDGNDAPTDPFNDIGVEVMEDGLVAATIFPNAISTRRPSPPPATRTSRTLIFETAGIVQDVFSGPTVFHRRFGTNESTPGTITLDAANGTVGGFASLLSLDGGFGPSTFVRFGVPTGGTQESAFVNDKLWGATESANPSQDSGSNVEFIGGVVSSGMVSLVGVLPMGVSLCPCQYVDWGFWSGQMNSPGVRREFALIPFAAGAPVNAAQFPISTMATYSGAAVANFYDGSHNFIAVGGLSVSASFSPGATVSLGMNITNLNGNNLTFNGSGNGTGAIPLTLVSASGPNGFDPMMSGSGSAAMRFAGPGTPPENVFGHFAAQDISGTNRAAGVAMGQR